MVFKFERKSTEKNVKKERNGAYYGSNIEYNLVFLPKI